MWDLPGPGIEPVYPASAGRFLTTAPPGKSHTGILDLHSDYLIIGSEAALFRNSRSRANNKFLS